MIIAIPAGIQIFCWVATLWSGARLQLKTPLLFVGGFITLFVFGGLSGIMLAAVPIDLQVHDTYFVVAHFHYVLIGGSIFPLFGAFYYWFPKWTGRMLNESLGKWNFWTFFIGFNLTFFPMHQLGLHGMTRRIYTYVPETGWGRLNLVATMGAGIISLSVVMFLFNVLRSRKRGEVAGENPWCAGTLEWATSSPPPSYNFLYLPSVAGRDALWDKTEISPVITGLMTAKREVLNTTMLEAAPDHRYEIVGDSIYPFFLALAVGLTFTFGIFNAWAFPIGAFFCLLALVPWFWSGTETEKQETDKVDKEPAPLIVPAPLLPKGETT
jgi:cytochrome c oxidase subunit 1